MWRRRDELAPPGHKRRSAFFANYARACAVVGQRGNLEQAVQLAADALSYATEPDVATELVAAARTMLGRATDQPPPQ